MPNIFHNSLSLGYSSYPTRGLIARYSFDDNLIDSYDSKGDLTQYSTGTQYWSYSSDTPGSIGKSCKMGSNDKPGAGLKNATDASVYNLCSGTNAFSISMWGKIDNTSQDLAALWSFYSSGSMIFGLWFGGPSYKLPSSVNGSFCLGLTGPAGTLIENTDYRASNIWRHYVYTYNGTTQKVYVNNIEKYSGSRSSLGSSNKFNFGHTNTSWCLGTNGNGYIDLFYFYNKALDTTEISQLYNGGAGI